MPTATQALHRRPATYLIAAVAMALLTMGAVTTSTPSASAASTEHAVSASSPRVAAGDAPPDSFWGDTGSIPPAQNVVMLKILNKTNGQYPDSEVYWKFNDQVHSIAEQPYFDMPANSAGRMYFYLGSPDSQYFDFIEFTVGDGVFNGNTTRVDAFGVKLAMRLHAADGYDVQVGEDYQTFQQSREETFQQFKNEVPTEFKGLADVQAPYRIPAPGSAPDFREGGQYADYFTGYAQSVGVNAPTSDITGCAGVLATDPGMCSALNRHVAQLPQSDWSNPGLYYQAAPANYYAKFWHDHGINNLAYGFPYDDYAGQSSFVSHGDPQWLEVAVGW
ncbi:glycoside hydrolase family 64 protein [Streptomyces sp. NPDC088725]|uniref:glycoside hydrolase family 64 protein n=1 Tax=Streptomyces sp. NPDC088725 TaxID=3365873 RepID=UPI0037FC2535